MGAPQRNAASAVRFLDCTLDRKAMRPSFRYNVTMSLQNSTIESAAPAPAAGPDLSPETRVLRQFRIVFNSVKTHFRQVERDAGLGGAQLWALSVIAGSPGIGVTGLARSLDIHQSTASNLVRTLTGRGLITAAREGQDRRGVALRALPAADALLQRAPMPFAGVLPDALASLDEETLRRLEQDLARLIEVLAADPASAQVPLAQL
ncbi:MAG: MarR family transcriptional regulator [Massilia sp.]|nr:MarR family transcriptional regulator [Massilia sp.]MDB5792710.1 MarR family transcriptional regulator [Massilia sp.]